MRNKKIAIIGSGITGLTTAYRLNNSGAEVDVFEKNSEPGGAIKTVRNDEWLTEYGPNTLLLKDKIVADFLKELGLHVDKREANPNAANRFIVRDGVLEPLPTSFFALVGTSLFSIQAKLNLLKEPFIPKSKNPDQTVAGFVERRLGEEILEYAINPFVAGIFASKPDNLSLRHAFPAMHYLEQKYGSLIWGSFAGAKKRKERGRIPRELISFKDGIQQLPLKIASRLQNVHYEKIIHRIKKEKNGWVLLAGEETLGPYDNVVVNIPLYMWNQKLLPLQTNDLARLQTVNYTPLSVFHLGFREEQIRHPLDGFGFLVPEKEKRNVLGALFPTTLFKGRAPEGHHLLTVFAGGGRQPELASMKTNRLLELVLNDLDELIGISGEPVYVDHVFWPKSIPEYHVGYDQILDTLQKIETQQPGLYIAGNFRNGISVPDCIMNGISLSERIQKER
jgi:protoporphyrinogen/coproporphyrinogen III oxidase